MKEVTNGGGREWGVENKSNETIMGVIYIEGIGWGIWQRREINIWQRIWLGEQIESGANCDSWGYRYARSTRWVMFFGECGGIIDYVHVSSVNYLNVIGFPFQWTKLLRNSSKGHMNYETGSWPCIYAKVSAWFGSLNHLHELSVYWVHLCNWCESWVVQKGNCVDYDMWYIFYNLY